MINRRIGWLIDSKIQRDYTVATRSIREGGCVATRCAVALSVECVAVRCADRLANRRCAWLIDRQVQRDYTVATRSIREGGCVATRCAVALSVECVAVRRADRLANRRCAWLVDRQVQRDHTVATRGIRERSCVATRCAVALSVECVAVRCADRLVNGRGAWIGYVEREVHRSSRQISRTSIRICHR